MLLKNFYKKFRNTYFPEHFLLTAYATRKEYQRRRVNVFAAYCFNFYYFNETRIKENSNLEVSTFLTMEDSLLVKTGDAT